MDEEMEDMVSEIDLDYEFDACMYFDLSREESFGEAREAEMWFNNAQSYPPSPFVAKLVLGDDIFLENINTSPKLKDEGNMTLVSGDFDDRRPVFSVVDVTNTDGEGIYGRTHTILTSGNPQRILNPQVQLTTGLTFYNHMTKDNLKDKKKSSVKPFSSRSSTLMKPTASQLAKQNQPRLFGDARFQTSLFQNNEKSSNNSSGVESQAAKRQKLEGGQLRKVADTKQQTSLVHKAPKKDVTVDGNSTHSKLKLTIPREPELETAHRAHRIRPKNNSEIEHLSLTAGFRARPLNRKILNAPSLPLPKKSTPRLPDFQVFHLKTLERAKQHSSAVPSSSFHNNDTDKGFHKPSTNSIEENRNKDFRRQTSMGAPKQDGCEIMHTFKARPLNKKIFSSKGDIGVFRNTKRENTVPTEFNFHTEKRIQQNPPVELFSKLSLTSQLQPSNGTQLKFPQPTHTSLKGSKENRLGFPHQEHRMMQSVRDKPRFQAEQTQCGTSRGITEICPQSGMSRGLGIR